MTYKYKMPKGVNEQDVLDTIENVVGRLARKFIFGYHSVEDIKQQGRMFALEGLQHYDSKRPLENFLWVHVRNRLYNYKRDNYERLSPPCVRCFSHYLNDSISACSLYEDREECVAYNGWHQKNISKKNLISPIGIAQVNDEDEKNMQKRDDVLENVITREMFDLVEGCVPLDCRAAYIKMRHNIPVPKAKRIKIQTAIKDVLISSGYWVPEEGILTVEE